MKKISAVFASAALLITVFIISLTVSAQNKKDPNCTNRCNIDYNSCVKSAKKLKIVERLNSEDECLRVRKMCYGLCPDLNLE